MWEFEWKHFWGSTPKRNRKHTVREECKWKTTLGCQSSEARDPACFTFRVSSLRVSQQQQWEINSLIMVRSTHHYFSTRLLETSDMQTLNANFILHRAVKGSISLLYIDHPQDPITNLLYYFYFWFPWKCTWGATLGSNCTNGFCITLNFREHRTYQLPKVAVEMSRLACKMLFMAPCWG